MQLELPLTQEQRQPRWDRRVEEVRTKQHVEDMLLLARQHVEDVEFKHERIDEQVFRNTAELVLRDMERRMVNVFIAYVDDEPAGYLVGTALPVMHRLGIVAEQRLWYVTPDKRGTFIARHLLSAFESWARINGATQIFTGVTNKRYSERVSRMLEHLGYARVGYVHVKEI